MTSTPGKEVTMIRRSTISIMHRYASRRSPLLSANTHHLQNKANTRLIGFANTFNSNSFSTNEKNSKEPSETKSQKFESQVTKVDYDDQDDFFEEPKTAGQKVAFYSTLLLQLTLLAAGCVCIFYTTRELFPGRMNPNSLFSELFDKMRYMDQITTIVGDNVKGFGRDSGRNTEGRRNHIDSFKYVGEDGSNRLRIRFNIKGKKGQVLVWAEVSDRMSDTEYVYLICQNTRTGRVLTLEDNRDQLEEEHKAMLAGVDGETGSNLLKSLPFFNSGAGSASGTAKP